jgi:acylphosphatase
LTSFHGRLYHAAGVSGEGNICRRWLVSGRVQGVGFRWSTRHAAMAIGLVGTVRNLPDGQVEVVARGLEAEVDQLEAWLHRGPPGAAVSGVRAEAGSLPHDLRGFQINY